MQDSKLFFSPQMFFIWSRQVTESFKMALEKDHSKKMRLKKKRQYQVCIAEIRLHKKVKW